MTAADLQPVLDKLDALTEAVDYVSMVCGGVILALGIVAGLLLIGLFLKHFRG